MQNFIFNKKWLISSSLLPLFFLNPLVAEDDGFFMGVSYQTSLAIQRVDNSGLNASQDAFTYIRQNAIALESAAVPLAYYLEAMGQQTRVLMQMLCPDPSKRCLLYAGGYPKENNSGDTGNNPPRGNVNATFDMQSLVNHLDKLTQLIGETLIRNPENLANAKLVEVKFGNQSTVIALPEGLANTMDALNNDITTALTTLWYNQTLTNKSFSTPDGTSVNFSPEVLQHLFQDGLATTNNNQNICSSQNQCTATNEAKSIAQNAQNIFQALMQAGILGGLANEKQFGFTYNKAPNGSDSQQGYQSFSGPGYYTKNSSDNNGTQAPLKTLPAGATVGSGNGQYTYHPSSAVYYLADSIIANGITASMIFSGMQVFANKAAKLTGTSSYSQMQDAINYGESLLNNTQAYGNFITNWVAPYLDLNNKGLNFLPNYGGQANTNNAQNTLTPQQAQQEQKVIMNQLEQATNAPTPAQIDKILANPYSPTAKTLMAYGLYRSKEVIHGVIDEMQTKVNQVYQMGFARNFLEHNSNSNNMNGFGVKMGYKQFFGKKRMFGLRYYGFYDFGYAQFGTGPSLVKATLSSYGAGTDFLYNVFTRKRGTEAIDIGFFAGIQLAGQTWKTNFLDQVDGNHLKPKDTSFQFLFDLGIRTNFSKIAKQRRSRFSQGIEFGLKIPVLYHTYYQSEGVTAKYRRAFSFYVGYNIGF
ncbi:Hop family outer membrane protein HopI [Helicobacter pylori]|uniref:Hop family outer membrane protein HopI n=1 Tax=Helicobacter pylori TaxID=210 RepID=UPI002966F95F|nr:Hop family outer membrane protein HopI [Helicobacter pylori]MDW3560395.1 Hop family outer membrane protein HopI [Helicobacter pylori]